MLLGSSTGRDGIGGVSVLASAGFAGEDGAASLDDAKRPSVQVGDPYEEKRLIEACLELLDRGLVVGIQDLGGAGLVCATSETAAKGGVGMDVDVTAVPLREPGMQPYEIMTSESQERMLAIITPENWPRSRRCATSGRCARTSSATWSSPSIDARRPRVGMLRVRRRLRRRDPRRGARRIAGRRGAALRPSARVAPRPRRRPRRRPDRRRARGRRRTTTCWTCWSTRRGSIASTTRSSSSTRSSDPGRDAALLRLAGPGLPASERGIAISTDSNPRWCALDPRVGTALTVAEGVANLACVGATREGGRQLPQLRQPRAPRGHVAALRVDRRHGRGLRRAWVCR